MECTICLIKKNNNLFKKLWICNHEFCIVCCDNIVSTNIYCCPLCREGTFLYNDNENKETQNILDINTIKNFSQVFNPHLYLNKWNKKNCLTNNHQIIIRKTFGVIAICIECNIIQCFNYLG